MNDEDDDGERQEDPPEPQRGRNGPEISSSHDQGGDQQENQADNGEDGHQKVSYRGTASAPRQSGGLASRQADKKGP